MPTKPTITIRPPPPADAEKINAFVEKTEEAISVRASPRQGVKTSRRPGAKAPLPKTVQHRKDGTLAKRMTVWMPNELAVRLSVQCATEQRDVSSALAEAAEAWLKGR